MAGEKFVVQITHHEGFIEPHEFRLISDGLALRALHEELLEDETATAYTVYENQPGFELPKIFSKVPELKLPRKTGWIYPGGVAATLEQIQEMRGVGACFEDNVRRSKAKKAVQTQQGTWALFEERDSIEPPLALFEQ